MSLPTLHYPTSLDDDTTLYGDPANRVELTLKYDIGTGDNAFQVNEDISDVNVPTFLVFSSGEIVYAAVKDDLFSQFSSVTRGAGGTTPQIHSSGEQERIAMVAEYLIQLKRAIVAIETELGITPSGSFADVVTRLANHNHSSGDNGGQVDTADLAGHDKAAHDGLGIDAGSLGGVVPSGYSVSSHTHAIGDLSNVSAAGEGHGNGLDADTVDGLEGAYLRDTLKAASGGDLTLATGAITVTGYSFYTLDPEGEATDDELVTINGGVVGDVVFLRLATLTDTIVVRDSDGNIRCPHSQDIYLTEDNPQIVLRKEVDGNWRVAQWVSPVGTIAISIGNGIDTIDVGESHMIVVPFDCEIVEWTLVGDQSGSIQIDLWQQAYGTRPTDAESITAAAPPAISSAEMARNSTLTGWTTSLVRGNLLTFHVESADTLTEALLSLRVVKK